VSPISLVRLGLLCLLAAALVPAPAAAQGNVLLVIADDVGVDRIAAYGAHPDAGPTPVIDALAAHGVLFRTAWADPLCSPTRAGMLTGRYAFRNGVGVGVDWNVPIAQQDAFVPVPDGTWMPVIARRSGVRTAAVGKWHLTHKWSPNAYQHPIQAGFERHLGAISNLAAGAGSYTNYLKNDAHHGGNSQSFSSTYATTDSVDDALELIDGFGADPWFVWLAFHAPHKPFHVPPQHLHSFGSGPGLSDADLYRAALEALDTELGRLLGGIRPAVLARTTVIFVGDNGTPKDATTEPTSPNPAKGSMYQGGVHVPLIIAGADVVQPGREVLAPVNTLDLHATVLELLGLGTAALPGDSVSLAPYLADPRATARRAWIYAERHSPNGYGPFDDRRRAVTDGRYKLIRNEKEGLPAVQFFDLETDAYEQANLWPRLDAQAARAYLALDAVLARLH
jgi:arylsulfatase A-like enzyme